MWASSDRWAVSKTMYLPSLDQTMVEALPLARKLMGLASPPAAGATQTLSKDLASVTLKATKDSVRRVREMTYQNAEEYLIRAQEALNWHDKSDGRHVAMKQFLDDKTFKPGLGTYDKTKTG